MANGKKPEFNGLLLTDAKDYRERKTVGKVALWRGVEKENAPVLQGVVQTEKGKYRVSLWKFKSKEGGL
ncbi:MAG: hypothetical protein WAO91_02455 [Candidatus Nitrosotenuis sp.]